MSLKTILICGLSRMFCGVFVGVCLTFTTNAQTDSKLIKLVNSISNGKLQVETSAKPYKLIADFNADGIKDVAVIVNLSDSLKNLQKIIKIEYPYAWAWTNEVNPEDLALLIIHGKGKGWQYSQRSSVLMVGKNSVMIFQKPRLGDDGIFMEIAKDRKGRTSLVFPTEASEGILKWNGKRYTWRETEP